MRDRIKAMKSIPLAKLRGFAGGNPKTPTSNDLDQLGESVDTHGVVVPLIVRELDDGTYELIDGHSRVNVYATRDPSAKVKAVVLDVASVAEGRRILLAIQHHVEFDIDKLESFVRDAIADGATAAELMADTGMTGADLDAFGDAARKLVEGAGGGGDPDETNERVSRAGLIPEHVQFGLPLTRPQSETVHAAIKLAKQLTGRKVSGDALEIICAEYLTAHRTHDGASPKKKRGKRAR